MSRMSIAEFRALGSRKRRERPEEIVQRACVDILELAVPAPPEGPAWTAINPVPAKSKAVAGISKAMGLRPGIPDLLMIFRGLPILVEFKSKTGSFSTAQRERLDEIEAAGGKVYGAWSVDDFVAILCAHDIPCSAAGLREAFTRITKRAGVG